MPLVDYSSDSDGSSSASAWGDPDTRDGPPKKKPRTATTAATTSNGSGPSAPHSALPPLPASFHDLYASTVRTTTHDDPALHQGRTRQTPHIPGNWPSHVYIEWHPPPDIHTLLTDLVSSLQEAAQSKNDDPNDAAAADDDNDGDDQVVTSSGRKGGRKITSLLVSALGAPQPLHISLSRPLSLAGRDRDGFLRDVAAQIGGSGRPIDTSSPPLHRSSSSSSSSSLPPAVALRCSGAVEWHRTAESGRSFLVLRVRSAARSGGGGGGGGMTSNGSNSGSNSSRQGEDDAAASAPAAADANNPNPELTVLLERCNSVAAKYGQPQLYTWALDNRGGEDGKRRGKVGDAFHVSIAWSFTEPTDELKSLTERIFGEPGVRERIREAQIAVEGVKVKIGNVVTHLPLPVPGRRGSGKGSRTLLGL